MLKVKPFRSVKYRKWVASFPCFRCGAPNRSQAAHIGKGGTGYKGCDTTILPLCTISYKMLGCHEGLDQHLDDKFWNEIKPRALEAAKQLHMIWEEAGQQRDAAAYALLRRHRK